MQMRLKIILGVFFLSLVFSALPQLAFAHATPIQYVPAASSVLLQTPTEVQIHFSKRVEPRVSSITVLGPDGSRVDLANSGCFGPLFCIMLGAILMAPPRLKKKKKL